nr:glycosyltransferase [uncultured Undibacterium sp.]
MQTKAIHQFHPACLTGDGVTNGMLFTQRLLRSLGFRSEIYCEHIPLDLQRDVRHVTQLALEPDYVLLVHHSLGYENHFWLDALDVTKIMVYHNITPEQYLPEAGPLRRLSVFGRQQLGHWAPFFLGGIGDSALNTEELHQAGFKHTQTIPLLVDLDRLRGGEINLDLLASLRGVVNLLYVGRICENKQQLALLDVLFELKSICPQPVRLILAGGISSSEYFTQIQERIHALDLVDQVLLAGKISHTDLLTYYRAADVFVCMSQHEGFGMPLIEAMMFDVPVLAHASSGIPGTMGEGGLLLQEFDAKAMAALVQLVLTEPGVRRRIIAGQRRNLERFDAVAVKKELADYLSLLGIDAPATKKEIVSVQEATWQVEGPLDSSYSLAVVNRAFARALQAQGKNVRMRSLDAGRDIPASNTFLKNNPDIATMLVSPSDGHAAPDVALRYCYPPYLDDMRARVRAIHCYGWEETGYPIEFAQGFNRKLDIVLAHTHFVKKALIDNGVSVPVAVIGGGADHIIQVQAQTPQETLKSFAFLHISSCFPRKGVDVLLDAYAQAFRKTDDVSLVIKTFPNPHNDVEQRLAQLRADDPEFPDVVLVNRDCSDEELAGWYQACDAFVAPSRGEGFGLPIAEAMLFDLPVITTAFGGQVDFCDEDFTWLCDFDFQKSRTHLGAMHSVWANPKVDHLAHLLREVFSLPEAQRRLKTDLAKQAVLRDFTWARTAENSIQAIAALDQRPVLRNEPKIAWISSWNKRCGIAAYSNFLSAMIPSDRLTVYADQTEERTAADDANVIRNWRMGFDGNLSQLTSDILDAGIGAVVIQYNFGFFTLSELANLIETLEARDISVHCFFHATADLVRPEQTFSLASIASALAKATRLYVHGVADLNRFKDFGLMANVTLFPQGLLPTPVADQSAAKRNLKIKPTSKVLASYGFLLPHKGLPQLIEAFVQLRASDPNLHLLLLNALYPVAESQREYEYCLTLIQQLGLTEHVTLLTEFLADEDCLTCLQAADLIVYPYQQTQESSSAAVRMGIASGVPVVVTPLDIFDDVGDAVFRLPGVSAPELAHGISAMLADSALLQQQVNQASVWAQSRQWPWLSTRLLNLIDALKNDFQ